MEKDSSSKITVVSGGDDCLFAKIEVELNENSKSKITQKGSIYTNKSGREIINDILLSQKDKTKAILGVSGSIDRTDGIKFVNLETMTIEKSIETGEFQTYCNIFLNDEKELVSSHFRLIQIWDSKDFSLLKKIPITNEKNKALRFIYPFNDQLIVGSNNGIVSVVNLSDSNVQDIVLHNNGIMNMKTLDFYGGKLTTSSLDETLKIWNSDFTVNDKLKIGENSFFLTLSNFKHMMVVADYGKGPRSSLWDLRTKTKIASFESEDSKFSYCIELKPGYILMGGVGFELYKVDEKSAKVVSNRHVSNTSILYKVEVL